MEQIFMKIERFFKIAKPFSDTFIYLKNNGLKKVTFACDTTGVIFYLIDEEEFNPVCGQHFIRKVIKGYKIDLVDTRLMGPYRRWPLKQERKGAYWYLCILFNTNQKYLYMIHKDWISHEDWLVLL